MRSLMLDWVKGMGVMAWSVREVARALRGKRLTVQTILTVALTMWTT